MENNPTKIDPKPLSLAKKKIFEMETATTFRITQSSLRNDSPSKKQNTPKKKRLPLGDLGDCLEIQVATKNQISQKNNSIKIRTKKINPYEVLNIISRKVGKQSHEIEKKNGLRLKKFAIYDNFIL